jgi:hypothetical protein
MICLHISGLGRMISGSKEGFKKSYSIHTIRGQGTIFRKELFIFLADIEL